MIPSLSEILSAIADGDTNIVNRVGPLAEHPSIKQAQHDFVEEMNTFGSSLHTIHCEYCKTYDFGQKPGTTDPRECQKCEKSRKDPSIRCRRFAHENDMDPFLKLWVDIRSIFRNCLQLKRC